MTYLLFFVLLSVIVLVHETGHFLSAKFFGIRVLSFSVGFGPKLLTKKLWDTEFRLSLIPLGGYVHVKAENPTEQVSGAPDEITSKSWWQKAIFAFSGPFSNLIFAFFILVVAGTIPFSYFDYYPVIGKVDGTTLFQKNDSIFRVNKQDVSTWSQIITATKDSGDNVVEFYRDGNYGKSIIRNHLFKKSWQTQIQPELKNIVGGVSIGFPAYRAGIKNGDIILQINSKQITDWYDIKASIVDESPVMLTFFRDGKNHTTTLKPIVSPFEEGRFIIGISPVMPSFEKEGKGFFGSIGYATKTSLFMVWTNYSFLFSALATPTKIANSIAGPILIGESAKQVFKLGLAQSLVFIAFINIVLMVMNLLPIPILDGGMIIFSFIEAIRKKPLSAKTRAISQKVGLFILLFLMLYAFYNDFSSIGSRLSSLSSFR